MIGFWQNQNLAPSKAFNLLRLWASIGIRQTSHDACLDGTQKQFAVI